MEPKRIFLNLYVLKSMWILWDKENYNYQNQLSDVQVDALMVLNFDFQIFVILNLHSIWIISREYYFSSCYFYISQDNSCSEFLSKTYLWWPFKGDSESNKNCIKRINCNIWYIWKIMCSKACCDKHIILIWNQCWLVLFFFNTKVVHISLFITLHNEQ